MQCDRCDVIDTRSVSEAMYAVLGCDCEQRNVPCGGGYGRDSLTRERCADEFGMQPVSAMTQEREASVVVPGAHADAVSCLVERGQRRDHQVESARRDCGGCALRFPDSVTIADKSRVGRQADEVHAAGRADYRHVDDAASGEGLHEQVAEVDFRGRGEVKADAPRGMPERAVREMAADGSGMTRARRFVECEAGPLSGLPVLCALGLHGPLSCGREVAPPACAVTSRRSRTRAEG